MRPDILTVTGTYFDFLMPADSHVSIEQVGHALSNLCRFTGHSRAFYSVAQHSVLTSYIVPPEIALEGLLHDACEAFLGDVSKPLKSLLPDYQAIEKRIERVILPKLGITLPMPPAVKHADLVALATEQRDLMPAGCGVWTTLTGIQPHPDRIEPLDPKPAYELFMARAHELAASRGK